MIQDPAVRRSSLFASCYLCAVDDAKGQHAFDLSVCLREHGGALAVPEHIQQVLRWVTKTEQAEIVNA
jgi:hypothetical protein